MARRSPSIVWIELTSKCPLRCVFCSRQALRGEGEHLDPALLAPLFSALDAPEILRLNYAGESANYPHLLEAIALARRHDTATIEMVTSLVTMPLDIVRALPGSGIDRISVSLHSTDAVRFSEIYGGGTLDAFERRLQLLVSAAGASSRPPAIDFAFVAMQRNAADLPRVAAAAAAAGAPALSIHPVIRRPGVPDLFQAESGKTGRLTPEFQSLVDLQAGAVRRDHATLPVSVARPSETAPYPGPFLCDQNPFETTHVLANGDVVPCEVLDRQPLGNIGSESFERIWAGEQYRTFRQRYTADAIAECATCVFRAPAPAIGSVQLSWGWHPADESGTLWSRGQASFTCQGSAGMMLRGLLPHAPGGNAVHFFRDGVLVASFHNASGESAECEIFLPLDAEVRHTFELRVDRPYSPWRNGMNGDTRQLGLALFSAEPGDSVGPIPPGTPAILRAHRPAAAMLLEVLSRPVTPLAPDPPTQPPSDSVSVLIPERGNPALLAACLDHLEAAIRLVNLPVDVTVIVNGSDPAEYAFLEARHPNARFHYYPRPMGFNAAIRYGLRKIAAGWTYLLNNDVRLHPEALLRTLTLRSADVFSIASRIQMDSPASEAETNRTALRFIDGLVDLAELDPASSSEHVYSGGGCSLFQTSWLRRFARHTSCYDPFYWEDVEWGLRARASGLRNLFVADSFASHAGKATVRRFYSPEEVSRIFERNRVQFQLRCIPGGPTPTVLARIGSASPATVDEWTTPRRLASLLRARNWFAANNYLFP